MIAPKPLKPCDGGVFGAFYLLLIRERQTTRRPAFRPSQIRPKSAPFSGLPMHSCFVANKAWTAPRAQRGCRGIFQNLSSAPPHAVLASVCALENAVQFHSRFNSNKARQTVRWRRFRGLLFAPDSRAANGKAARIQAKPKPNPNPARMRPELASFDDLPMRSCFHGERDLSCARTAAQQPKAVFFRTCPAPRRKPFCRRLRFGKRRPISLLL